MSTADRIVRPTLQAGQRLSQPEFHESYKATPEHFRAELIGGVVSMPCPVSHRHDDVATLAGIWVGVYSLRTPGVKAGREASLILDDLSEVHADGFLRIKPEQGGQTRQSGIYIGGSPELIIEVSASSRSRDLGTKLAAYERAVTQEYVVLAIDPDEVFWHVRRDDRLVRIEADADGIYRSKTFPGLWLDPAALFEDNGTAVMATLELGLANPDHTAFLARLTPRP